MADSLPFTAPTLQPSNFESLSSIVFKNKRENRRKPKLVSTLQLSSPKADDPCLHTIYICVLKFLANSSFHWKIIWFCPFLVLHECSLPFSHSPAAAWRVWGTPTRPYPTPAGLLQQAHEGSNKETRESLVHPFSSQKLASPQGYRKQEVLKSKTVLAVCMTKAQSTRAQNNYFS